MLWMFFFSLVKRPVERSNVLNREKKHSCDDKNVQVKECLFSAQTACRQQMRKSSVPHHRHLWLPHSSSSSLRVPPPAASDGSGDEEPWSEKRAVVFIFTVSTTNKRFKNKILTSGPDGHTGLVGGSYLCNDSPPLKLSRSASPSVHWNTGPVS